MTRFIVHLYIPHLSTRSYNAIANPHTLQITTAHANSSQFVTVCNSRCLVTDPTDGYPSSLHTSSLSGEYSTTELTQPAWGPLYSLGEDPTENTNFYIVMCGCLPVAPDIVDVFTGRYQATHVSPLERCITTILHATIWFRRIYGWKCRDQPPLLQRVFRAGLMLISCHVQRAWPTFAWRVKSSWSYGRAPALNVTLLYT
jgi:hypothetical protein